MGNGIFGLALIIPIPAATQKCRVFAKNRLFYRYLPDEKFFSLRTRTRTQRPADHETGTFTEPAVYHDLAAVPVGPGRRRVPDRGTIKAATQRIIDL